ncbi:4-deoxy-4-formamido-L-arabinose-phosphoundecaprenol deformylase [Chitinibacter fontanus]|uniref:4-deoxy-4-formamido-L-arabinose-phosphoundecaprenol deformylase n=1 Tax=Chitinibacter fontanus TaxID=1737446 RepID=A0A7D5VBT8_9NEIS|nr:4-deoxy-4-formamido-L-arabinose-phosphoundecaprenol deformylase [Chitinibacter fontanus]QLI82692.1 4-deoxy-4-formamido-L-arabinose-phosphoundecaprenol deformylase [Chitinibacter fontanus]
MKLIALKIDVDTSVAIEIGLPKLIPVLRANQAGATFFWALGKEKNGSLLRPMRYLRKVAGMSHVPIKQRYGLAALLAGSLLPSRNLNRLAENAMRELTDEVFEHGVRPAQRHCWQASIVKMDSALTRDAYAETLAGFEKIMGQRPRSHAASGWQINRTALRLHQLHQLNYASDCRGQTPFWPIVQGEYIRCPQLPVTLPMLEELIPQLGVEQAFEQLKHATLEQEQALHVFNLAADYDAQYAEQVGQLLSDWKAQGYHLVNLSALVQALDLKTLPYHHVEMKPVPGRLGLLAVQGAVYP